MDGEQETTWFGGAMSRADIEDEDTSFGACHPDAIKAIFSGWQVTIVDPEWGRNDVLWPVLEGFAKSHQA